MCEDIIDKAKDETDEDTVEHKDETGEDTVEHKTGKSIDEDMKYEEIDETMEETVENKTDSFG